MTTVTINPISILSAETTSSPLVRGAGPTTWTIAIDWDRSGSFDGANDDVTDEVVSARWFLGARKPYQDTPDDSMLTLRRSTLLARECRQSAGGKTLAV